MTYRPACAIVNMPCAITFGSPTDLAIRSFQWITLKSPDAPQYLTRLSRIARSVGLPVVIAHGMYTMAQAGRFVAEWAGDPGAVTEFGVRFSAMVPVPDDDQGAAIEVSGTVADKLGDNKVAVELTARADGAKVLTRARAVVRLP